MTTNRKASDIRTKVRLATLFVKVGQKICSGHVRNRLAFTPPEENRLDMFLRSYLGDP